MDFRVWYNLCRGWKDLMIHFFFRNHRENSGIEPGYCLAFFSQREAGVWRTLHGVTAMNHHSENGELKGARHQTETVEHHSILRTFYESLPEWLKRLWHSFYRVKRKNEHKHTQMPQHHHRLTFLKIQNCVNRPLAGSLQVVKNF